MEALSGSVPDSLIWLTGGLGDSFKKPAGPSAVHILHPIRRATGAGILKVENVTDTVRATVHIPTQPGIAIAAELPQLNLRNGAFEEGENCAPLHKAIADPRAARFDIAVDGQATDQAVRTSFLW